MNTSDTRFSLTSLGFRALLSRLPLGSRLFGALDSYRLLCTRVLNFLMPPALCAYSRFAFVPPALRSCLPRCTGVPRAALVYPTLRSLYTVKKCYKLSLTIAFQAQNVTSPPRLRCINCIFLYTSRRYPLSLIFFFLRNHELTLKVIVADYPEGVLNGFETMQNAQLCNVSFPTCFRACFTSCSPPISSQLTGFNSTIPSKPRYIDGTMWHSASWKSSLVTSPTVSIRYKLKFGRLSKPFTTAS